MAPKSIASGMALLACLVGAPASAEPAAATLLRGSGGMVDLPTAAERRTAAAETVSEEEVLAVQAQWRYAVLNISAAYLAQPHEGGFVDVASNAVHELYGYNMGPVMFKPTLAAEEPFRPTFEGALSYFVGYEAIKPQGHKEDKGFAINGGEGWSKVVFVNDLVSSVGDVALTHGYYYFTNAKTGGEVAVEYSFVYKKDNEKKLKIILHHSSVPFSP